MWDAPSRAASSMGTKSRNTPFVSASLAPGSASESESASDSASEPEKYDQKERTKLGEDLVM